jgi:hypothetical protein
VPLERPHNAPRQIPLPTDPMLHPKRALDGPMPGPRGQIGSNHCRGVTSHSGRKSR